MKFQGNLEKHTGKQYFELTILHNKEYHHFLDTPQINFPHWWEEKTQLKSLRECNTFNNHHMQYQKLIFHLAEGKQLELNP